jgi:hypothetical protein
MSIYDEFGFVLWTELPSCQLATSLHDAHVAMVRAGSSGLVVFDGAEPVFLVTSDFIQQAWDKNFGSDRESDPTVYDIAGLSPLWFAIQNSLSNEERSHIHPIAPYRLNPDSDPTDLDKERFQIYPMEASAASGWYFVDQAFGEELFTKPRKGFECSNGHANLKFNRGVCYLAPKCKGRVRPKN